MRTVRIYCRNHDKEVCDHLTTCYHQFIAYVQKIENNRPLLDRPRSPPGYAAELNVLSQSPNRCSNESFAVSQSSLADLDDEPKRKRPKKEGSLFDQVMEAFEDDDNEDSS